MITPTPPFALETIISALKVETRDGKNKIDVVCTYPAMIQRIATSHHAEERLKLFGRMLVGGAPASASVQRWMEEAGLQVCNFMGSFEFGPAFDTSRTVTYGWNGSMRIQR